MLIEIIALIAGILAGTITGLIPGIHINTIAVLLISFLSLFLIYFSPISLAIFIVAMSIAHIFVDFIPSIFLGCPNEDTALSILPGHKLLLEGKGYEAIILSLYGCLAGMIIVILSSPIYLFLLPKVYFYLEKIMFLVLIVSSIYLISTEKNSKILAFIIFILSGFLGLATFNLNLSESLMPLLTGLFGASSILTSLKSTKLPKQKIPKLRKIKLEKNKIFGAIKASIVSSPLCSFLPGLGSSQAALIGSEIIDEKDDRQFLFLIGAINIIVMAFSFLTLYSINKSRTGSAAAISQILENFRFNELIIILITIILVTLLSFFISIFLAKKFSTIISKIKYNYLSILVLIILIVLVDYITGIKGLLVFAVSTCLGITTIFMGIRRTHMLGCLVIPAIIFSL